MADEMTVHAVSQANQVSYRPSAADDSKVSIPEQVEFPDGTVIVRNEALFPVSHGYDKNIIDERGQPRFASADEISLMKSWNPALNTDGPIYRKDYMAEFDKAMHISRGVDGKVIKGREKIFQERHKVFDEIHSRRFKSYESFRQQAIDDAIASEGDKQFELRQREVDRRNDAKNFKERFRFEEDMTMAEKFPASEGQIKLMYEHYDSLAPFYKEKMTREQLAQDATNLIDRWAANDAIKGMFARESLKNYLASNDERWETMNTEEAVALAEKYRGKINLRQQAFYNKRGLEFDPEKTTFAEAKATMEQSEPTARQIEYAKGWMPKDQMEKLNFLEMDRAIKAHIYEQMQRDREEVPHDVYKHAVEHKLVNEGDSYTRGQWAKDCFRVPPMKAELAYVERFQLHNEINAYLKKYPETYREPSQALYAKIHAKNEERWAEKTNSLCDSGQINFFAKRGVDISPETSWHRAQEDLCKQLYFEKLVGQNDAKYLSTHDIKVPDEVLKASAERELLTPEKRLELRTAVHALCQEDRVRDRMYRIETSFAVPNQNDIFGCARNVCAKHLEEKKTLEGVEKVLAERMVRGDFRMPADLEAAKGSREAAFAHVITCVLPNSVEYKASLERNLAHVNTAMQEFTADKTAEVEKAKTRGRKKANEGMEA